MVKMNENNRNYIMESMRHHFDYYSESIDINLRNDKLNTVQYFVRQIESVLNFVDGI